MMLYNSDLSHKNLINVLQLEYDCCGSRRYSDWFKIEWYNRQVELPFIYQHPSQGYDVPYSCCKKDYLKPCTNYNLLKDATNQDMMAINTRGCTIAVAEELEKLQLILVQYRMLMVALLALFIILARLVATHFVSRFIRKDPYPAGYIWKAPK